MRPVRQRLRPPPRSLMQKEICRFLASRPDFAGVRATSKPKKSNRGGPKHANEHTFRKGTTVHRPSGAENRLNKQCKEMLATCFESVGGLPGLVKWVKESPQNRGAFYTRMWVRLVGLDVHIKDEHKNVVYRTLDEINAALGEQGLTLEMLERLCRYEDEQPRLIEHVRVGLAPKPRRCRSMSMPLFCGSGNLTSIAEALRFLAIPVGADEQQFAAGWRAMPSLSPIHRHHILRTISHARPSARQSRWCRFSGGGPMAPCRGALLPVCHLLWSAPFHCLPNAYDKAAQAPALMVSHARLFQGNSDSVDQNTEKFQGLARINARTDVARTAARCRAVMRL